MLKGAKVRVVSALLLISGEVVEGMDPKNTDETVDESAVERQIADVISRNEDLFEIRSLLIQLLIRDTYKKDSKEEKRPLATLILKSMEDVRQRMVGESQA